MFDFTDFLAFMAIEDAMEEEKDSSPKYSSNSSNEDLSSGCAFACLSITFAIFLGVILESWGWFIGVAVIGSIIGVAYDVHKNKKTK